MSNLVVFHLAKYFPPRSMQPYDMAHPETLYERIRSGEKKSEWRDATPYWFKRLCFRGTIVAAAEKPMNITGNLKVKKAWFVQGYPKGNLPRLEANITGLVYHSVTQQLEIQFANVMEVTVNGCYWCEPKDPNSPEAKHYGDPR